MFEEQEKGEQKDPGSVAKSSSPSLPMKAPEDMLASVDSAPSSPFVPKKSVPLSEPSGQPSRPALSQTPNTSGGIPEEYLDDGSRTVTKIIAAAFVALIVIAGAGGAWWYFKGSAGNKQPVATTPIDTNAAPTTEVTPRPDLQLQGQGPASPEDDSDQDGLSNAQEITAGTDPQNPDTDGDGLFDGEEVRSFGTDPLKPDTDGDGFSDGAEVRNGYNPKGLGKLFNVPK
ncbi:MAG: hypothetical protein WC817_01150 [Patescibacteria group bacterium]|jgi:hypothetical protein